MREGLPLVLAASALLAMAEPSQAQQPKCLATGEMGGKKFTMAHCAASFYLPDNSVTLWFSSTPIPPEEVKAFEMNAYPIEKDAAGKRRTNLHVAFCPGGGKLAASPAAVPFVELGMDHADSLLAGRQWVFSLSKDKDLKIEKLAGEIKAGGRLSGRITGARSTEKSYSWQIEFDVRLPEKDASAGTGCGS